MAIFFNLVGIFSGLLLVLNLILLPLIVIFFGLLAYLPIPIWQRGCRALIQWFTHGWMAVNNGIVALANLNRFDIHGDNTIDRHNSYILFANHQSWADILVLSKVFNKKIPLLKFFLKKQLFWALPLAGFACKFAGYPFMARATREQIRKKPSLKGYDLQQTILACRRFKERPSTATIFVESTRYSKEKAQKQNSPFEGLLKPQVASVALVLEHMAGGIDAIIDVSIRYQKPNPTLWHLLCGNVGKIEIYYRALPITPDLIGHFEKDREYRKHIQSWLNTIWQQKSSWLKQEKPSYLRLATRKSPMALMQAQQMRAQLQQTHANCFINLVGCSTKGDRVLNRALSDIGGKSLFTKEVQHALLAKRADFAVHSVKDLSVFPVEGLTLAALTKRDDPRDAFVSMEFESLESLPKGAIVGTASPRRSAQLLHYRPDLKIKLCRGNVNSRLRKLEEGEYHAILLATAGLERLQLTSYLKQRLNPTIFIPAIGQGALGIECRAENKALIQRLHCLNDPITNACVEAERAVNRVLGGDCHTPIGAHAVATNNRLHLQAMVANMSGDVIYINDEAPITEASQLGERVGQRLIEQGALELIGKN